MGVCGYCRTPQTCCDEPRITTSNISGGAPLSKTTSIAHCTCTVVAIRPAGKCQLSNDMLEPVPSRLCETPGLGAAGFADRRTTGAQNTRGQLTIAPSASLEAASEMPRQRCRAASACSRYGFLCRSAPSLRPTPGTPLASASPFPNPPSDPPQFPPRPPKAAAASHGVSLSRSETSYARTLATGAAPLSRVREHHRPPPPCPVALPSPHSQHMARPPQPCLGRGRLAGLAGVSCDEE